MVPVLFTFLQLKAPPGTIGTISSAPILQSSTQPGTRAVRATCQKSTGPLATASSSTKVSDSSTTLSQRSATEWPSTPRVHPWLTTRDAVTPWRWSVREDAAVINVFFMGARTFYNRTLYHMNTLPCGHFIMRPLYHCITWTPGTPGSPGTPGTTTPKRPNN